MKPNVPPGKLRYATSSGGMPSDHQCGRQQSGAPPAPERRGSMSIVLVAGLGSVDIHAMARKAAERWMKAQKLVSVLS
jgi:hypothetical protein